ncbi:cupin [Zhengella mangrovi]|uniref:Cupin n=1 Tax=Zhengella mangrovi TaxID=1982044 RepID=A0A2G1QN09_9HYPH|nr:cupin domain-containing protein [Zhengella mangrovi]PHP66851.1 cupin [Zhengella mangrovi]
MRINDDLTRPVIVHAGRLDWVPSPAAGVDRRMLYRVGGEVARATSIVRYARGSAFPAHVHNGGEEILVLEGTFQDEHADYPAGSYFRNPPGTSHSPASADGCTIFVRLWQFREADDLQLVRQPGEGDPAPLRPGVAAARVLFDDGIERVTLEDCRPDAPLHLSTGEGLEVLVLAGSLDLSGERWQAQSWGRFPAGMDLAGTVGASGATLWLKQAPLALPGLLPMPG